MSDRSGTDLNTLNIHNLTPQISYSEEADFVCFFVFFQKKAQKWAQKFSKLWLCKNKVSYEYFFIFGGINAETASLTEKKISSS